MIENPNWLPDMLNLDGEWSIILDKLFEIFNRDFTNSKPRYNDLPIWWNRRKIDDDKDEGFWHLITNDEKTVHNKIDRIPDYDRARRLPWCRAVIENAHDTYVTIFEYLEGQVKNNKPDIRTYLWLKDWDYVVILAKNTKPIEHYYIVTTFYLNYISSIRRINNKYKNRIK